MLILQCDGFVSKNVVNQMLNKETKETKTQINFTHIGSHNNKI